MQTLREVSCRHCEVTFQAKRSDAKYCSQNCKSKYFYHLDPNKKKKSTVQDPDVRAAFDKTRQQQHIEYIRAIKLEKGCSKCGYNKHAVALDFNHLDPSTKDVSVSRMSGYSKERIDEEIAKCEILCANCHRVHSYDNKHFHNSRLREAGA